MSLHVDLQLSHFYLKLQMLSANAQDRIQEVKGNECLKVDGMLLQRVRRRQNTGSSVNIKLRHVFNCGNDTPSSS